MSKKLQKHYLGAMRAIVRANRWASGGKRIDKFDKPWIKRQAREAAISRKTWPIKTNVEKDILDGMSRLAYSMWKADRDEERGISPSQRDVYLYKPTRIPSRAKKWAREVAIELLFQEKAESLSELYDIVVTKYDYTGDAEQFGNDLAYEAVGAGVNWRDRAKVHNIPNNVIDVPHHEFYL